MFFKAFWFIPEFQTVTSNQSRNSIKITSSCCNGIALSTKFASSAFPISSSLKKFEINWCHGLFSWLCWRIRTPLVRRAQTNINWVNAWYQWHIHHGLGFQIYLQEHKERLHSLKWTILSLQIAQNQHSKKQYTNKTIEQITTTTTLASNKYTKHLRQRFQILTKLVI